MTTSVDPTGAESRPQTRSPFLERLPAPASSSATARWAPCSTASGCPPTTVSTSATSPSPRLVLEIHQAYMEAGAEIIETNTYGANRFKLGTYDLGDKVRAINFRGAKLAGNAREIVGLPVLIAGSVGPLGAPMQPLGRIALATARDIFREQIEALLEGGVDLLMLETFKDLREMLIALRAAREACDLPIVAQMSFEEDGRTLAGNTPAEVVRALEEAGADVDRRQLLDRPGAHGACDRRDGGRAPARR